MRRVAVGAAVAALCACLTACESRPCEKYEERSRIVYSKIGNVSVPRVAHYKVCTKYGRKV